MSRWTDTHSKRARSSDACSFFVPSVPSEAEMAGCGSCCAISGLAGCTGSGMYPVCGSEGWYGSCVDTNDCIVAYGWDAEGSLGYGCAAVASVAGTLL